MTDRYELRCRTCRQLIADGADMVLDQGPHHASCHPLEGTHARARHTDPDTAHLSAAKVKTRRIDAAILELLCDHYEGLTSRELTALSGLERVSVSPRLARLADKGLVHDSGERRVSPETHHSSIIWQKGARP